MQDESDAELLTTQPIVTIMVDSPKDPPNIGFGIDNETQPLVKQPSIDQAFTFDVQESVDVNKPIDVNEPRDTTNIFYDYEEKKHETNVLEEDEKNIESDSTAECTQSFSGSGNINDGEGTIDSSKS